ncbi:ribosome maturation factor RimM [Rhodocaloribacter litoris]|uniref:ribosome maturation factor RimM n=1 Tax=Rhodocaloribacter litoris TaxID=2558931 RepID=UPI0014213F9C|nr:ribosome maturation factor RimM [Rhodocaloribacter litoris]QXD14693.1 ribosome maturation factor RimM [Rhodocaloribacter litoris]
MKPDNLLLVGRVYRAHGIRGEVKVIPETDDPERFTALATVYLGTTPERVVPHRIETVRFQQTRRGLLVVLKVEGVDTREAAEALRPLGVFASREDLPPLGEDEFFYSDLVGLRVVAEGEEGIVGHVEDVLELPAHPVLLVRRPGGAEAMVPAVPAFIAAIDFDAGEVVVRPIEGLFA